MATRLQKAGEPAVSVCRQLGIARKTLVKWLGEAAKPRRRRGASAGFVRVGVKAPGRGDEIAGAAGVRLVSPHGYRIEWVDVMTAVAILREVG